jgi:hypothetical protein
MLGNHRRYAAFITRRVVAASLRVACSGGSGRVEGSDTRQFCALAPMIVDLITPLSAVVRATNPAGLRNSGLRDAPCEACGTAEDSTVRSPISGSQSQVRR